MLIDKLLLATHNEGKIRELREWLAPYIKNIATAAKYKLEAPAETGITCLENAKLKALAAMRATNLPALADDSGLEVAALNGAPGVYSADWAGETRDYTAAMQRIHNEMGNASDRRAAFVAVLALALPDGTIQTFEGRCHGHIIWPPRGDHGFGYDPLMVPDGFDTTFAQKPELKKLLSHRARALEQFIAWLSSSRTAIS